MELKSTHAFFFNPALGVCKEDLVAYTPLEIGNDVWIGHGAIIHPHVRRIGDGAVIGAGAVVNKDVPPYAVVTGNPSRIVRYRFSKKVIEELLASRWWEKSIGELKPHLQEFQRALSDPAERQGEGE
jgi:acetyltransferase-like isoleucine patch superfamily enzyme